MKPTMTVTAKLAASLLLVAASIVQAGCSSATTPESTGFTSAAYQTFATDQGKLDVELRLSPQPPVAGLDGVQYVVTDAATGAPVDGLMIEMTPWMPAMGHGSSVTPQLTALGNGVYEFTDVSLFMPGEWQLRTKFSGQVVDSATPAFSVP
jgi:hypothetical protein